MALTKITSRILDSSGVTILGTIATGEWAATDIAVLHGGTGASTAGAARTNLGLVIGTHVLAQRTFNDTNWDNAYADRLKWDGGATGLTASTGRTSLGLGTVATTAASDYATAAQGTKADTAHGWGNHAGGGYVKTTTDQTIAGVKTFSGEVIVPHGKISILGSNNLTISGTVADHAGLSFATNAILPATVSATNTNTVDLGASSEKFKNLYLGSEIISGGGATFGSIVTSSGLTVNTGNGAGKKIYLNGNTSRRNWLISSQENVDDAFEITRSTANGGSTYNSPSFLIQGSTGNVGIGTTLPVTKLNISNPSASTGSAAAGRLADSSLHFDDTTHVGRYSQITFGYPTSNTHASAYVGYVSTSSSASGKGDLVFGTKDNTGYNTQPTERMRILAAGNILIGATNADIGGSVPGIRLGSNGSAIFAIAYANPPHYSSPMSVDRRNTSGDGNMYTMWRQGIFRAGIGLVSNAMVFNIGNGANSAQTERMRIGSSTNTLVLKGTGTTGSNYLQFQNSSSTVQGYVGYGSSGSNTLYIAQQSANSDIIMYNGGQSRLTIESGGAATFGGTVTSTSGFLGNATTSSRFKSTAQSSATATNANLLYTGIHMNYYSSGTVSNTASGGYGTVISFGGSGGGVAGSLQMQAVLNHNSSSNATNSLYFRIGNNLGYSNDWKAFTYTAVSDYRLKENIKPMNSVIDRIKSMNAVSFNFINEPDKEVEGFIAHEVQEIIPEAVLNEKDKVGSNGTPMYQSIDYSKITPFLIKAIQEQQAQIELLKQEVELLKQ